LLTRTQPEPQESNERFARHVAQVLLAGPQLGDGSPVLRADAERTSIGQWNVVVVLKDGRRVIIPNVHAFRRGTS